MPEFNNWDVSYGAIRFFEDALASHKRVAEFERRDDIFFVIKRSHSLSQVNVLLINVYTVGLADMFRAKRDFPDLDCVVTCANWNGYTREAKEHAVKSKLGLFVVGEFFGALWVPGPFRYVQKDEDGNPIHH
jgi:hypothetical protein